MLRVPAPLLALTAAGLLAGGLAVTVPADQAGGIAAGPGRPVAPLAEPADWLAGQRAAGDLPGGEAFARAAAQARAVAAFTQAAAPDVAAAAWELLGPTNIGGRVTDLAVDPQEADTVYVAAASGGVWVTRDGGATLEPVWPEDQTQAIGALAIASDGTLYAGTGEANPGGGSITFGGTGMYRSRDRGASWELVGLEASGAFGRIVVDPDDPQRIWAAAAGDLFVPGGERGVYRSTDGGDTWDQVLEGANPTTGAADLAVDPSNPDRVFAAMWDHLREPQLRTYGGVGSGLYASEDGGDTWSVVEDVPHGTEDVGRIGVAIAQSSPTSMYATVIATDGSADGIYRSSDGGASWSANPTAPLFDTSQGGFGWWFGRLWVDPQLPTHVFIPGIELLESFDGGLTFLVDATVHADQHAMAWDPARPGRVYLGNDGGLYASSAGGAVGTWVKAAYEPYTQLYTLDVGELTPDRLVAGLQDNGCVRNYSATSEPAAGGWSSYGCGDGLETLISPADEAVVYGCSQYGSCSRSSDGGETSTPLGESTSDRRNWLVPLELDPADPQVMYYAGNVVNRSTDGGQTWTAISPDLTLGEAPDPIYPFGTATTIGVAASDPQRLYVGTDDGLLWTTADQGGTWEPLEDPALPRIWVTRLTVDPVDAAVVYAAFSGFRSGDEAARVVVSRDAGATFADLSGNLPAAPVNDLTLAGPALVAATDVGVYATRLDELDRRGGPVWLRVGDGPPLAPVMDLRWHAGTGTLTAGTFGRGAWRVELPELPEAPPPGGVEVLRLAGDDRFATAAAISAATYPDGAEVAYVATGTSFADALSGAPAAAGESAPVLLVGARELPAATREELVRLDPSRVVVLGGAAAVSEAVAEEVAAATGAEIERLAGPDRFATAAAVSAAGHAEGVEVVYVATAAAFADALAGGAAAGRDAASILLAAADGLPGVTRAELERLAPGRVVLLGGEAVLPAAVAEEIAEVTGVTPERVSGADRFATAAAIAEGFEGGGDAYLVTGLAFADALAGAAAAALAPAPVLLTDTTLPAATADALAALAPTRLVVLGGTAAVSADAVAAALVAAGA